jgi:hypothetical protein
MQMNPKVEDLNKLNYRLDSNLKEEQVWDKINGKGV